MLVTIAIPSLETSETIGLGITDKSGAPVLDRVRAALLDVASDTSVHVGSASAQLEEFKKTSLNCLQEWNAKLSEAEQAIKKAQRSDCRWRLTSTSSNKMMN